MQLRERAFPYLLIAAFLALSCIGSLAWVPGAQQPGWRHLTRGFGQRPPARREAAAPPAVAAAVAASAGVHGFVDKQGMLDPVVWVVGNEPLAEQRDAAKRKWWARRDASLAKGTPPPPLPMLDICLVYVNHLYKTLYVRHAKTGSTSFMCHFNGCSSRAVNASNFDPGAFVSLHRHEELPRENGSVADLEAVWRDYFVVTFVRNPYRRAVSMYNMFVRDSDPNGTMAESYLWGDFCADPAGFVDVCAADAVCPSLSPNGARAHASVHIQPQLDCMLTLDGEWAVDFIGRAERMDEDVQTVLAEMERRRVKDAPRIKPLKKLARVNAWSCNATKSRSGQPTPKHQYCDITQYYSGLHADCFGGVAAAYAADVVRLRYGGGGGGGGNEAGARDARA